MSQEPSNRVAGLAPSDNRTNWLRIGVGALALALLLTFCAQNWQSVQVHVLVWTWDTHMLWALLVSAALGVVATLGFTTLRARRRRKRAESLRRAA